MVIIITAEVMADWKVRRVVTKETVFHGTISGAYTATVGDAVVGDTRAKIADGTAARKKIERGLQMIADLNL